MTDTKEKGDGLEQFYSTERVAEMFEVTVETVRDWISRGELKAVKVNRQWRVPESALRDYTESLYR